MCSNVALYWSSISKTKWHIGRSFNFAFHDVLGISLIRANERISTNMIAVIQLIEKKVKIGINTKSELLSLKIVIFQSLVNK